MKTGYLRSAFITIGSFLFVITAVTAWTGPPGNPPNPNVAAPLNVSATAQQKAGPLGINTNTAPSSGFGLLVGNNALISGKAFVGVSTADTDPGKTLVTKDYMLSKVGSGVTLSDITSRTSGTIKACRKVKANTVWSGNSCLFGATVSCGSSEIALDGGFDSNTSGAGWARITAPLTQIENRPADNLKSWIVSFNAPSITGGGTSCGGGSYSVYATCCTVNQ